jgi:branched-chain amino acid transport system permease protein
VKRAIPVLAVVLLFAAPLVVKNPFFLDLGIVVLMWATLGIAWNLLGGYAGQVSFGHAAFYGVGAYATMILYLRLGIAPWYGIVLGGLIGALISVPIGYLCFRLRGPYFSLATLAVAEIMRLVATNWDSLTAGPMGLLITHLPPVNFFGTPINWERKEPFFYLMAVIAVATVLAALYLTRSRLGAYLAAIRENEDAAESIGIDTTRAKVVTLAVSAFFTATAGGFYALYYRYLDPDAVFPISLSIETVFIAVVGGLGTVAGPILGAVFLTTFAELFREHFAAGHLIFYGLCMMLVIRFLPDGIWGRAARWLARRKEKAHGAA